MFLLKIPSTSVGQSYAEASRDNRETRTIDKTHGLIEVFYSEKGTGNKAAGERVYERPSLYSRVKSLRPHESGRERKANQGRSCYDPREGASLGFLERAIKTLGQMLRTEIIEDRGKG